MSPSRLSVVLNVAICVVALIESCGWGQPYVPEYANRMLTARTQYGVLDGAWRVVWFEHQGESNPQLASALQFVFDGQSLRLLQRSHETITVTYNYDPRETPGRFDWSVERDGQLLTQRGLCLHQDDTLAICVSKVGDLAPTDLTTGRRDGRTLFVLTREESQSTQDVSDSWLRLGVYELMPEGESNARVIVMLAVHRGGTILGQSYEVGTEQQSAVRGTINKQTRQVDWTDTQGTVSVRTDLDSFAQEEATAAVRFHNATEATWTMRFISAPLQILSNARTRLNNERAARTTPSPLSIQRAEDTTLTENPGRKRR